jgi:dTDP-4-amino-4,6-dideoxygalactose transaminase
MIQTFSSTIRRKEMDAVLTCMVDEKIGPGELNTRFIQTVKEFTGCEGAAAFRSPQIALSYALRALDLEKGSGIMISALAPSWQYVAVEALGYKPVVLDVSEATGLVTAEIAEAAMKNGSRLLILHETMGIVPEDIEKIIALGIPVIEDISQSVGAVVPLSSEEESEGVSVKKTPEPASGTDGSSVSSAGMEISGEKAGSFGIYTILGLEEHDTITAGGGAVLMAPGRREWIVLKKYTDEASRTDILPDINSALAWIQIKEFNRNEESRKNLFALYQNSLMSGKHKTYLRASDNGSTIWSFPVVLASGFKDVKQYAARKDIDVRFAYEDSVIARHEEELSSSCKHAKSLLFRCALFPLYPRLTSAYANKIIKVLGTLP